LRIPAATFNTMLDAAEDFKSHLLNRRSNSAKRDTKTGIVIVRNQSGADRAQFDVMGISGVVVSPSQNYIEFANRFCFNAVLPTASHTSKFVVLQEPIKNGAMGEALIVGVTPVYITRPSGDSSDFAGVNSGQTILQTGLQGAQIIWEDSFTGTNAHLAVVRMPSGGAASSPTNIVIVNRVPLATDGAAGNITTNGSQVLDGSASPNGSLVLLRFQTTVADRGIWKVNTGGPWTKNTPFQPTLIIVSAGTNFIDTAWYTPDGFNYRIFGGAYG